MRRFCSYGPVDTDLHYYVPREALIERVRVQLEGENPRKGGHYITIWAPRQTGKTWVMQQVAKRILAQGGFEVAYLTMQSARNATSSKDVLGILVRRLEEWVGRRLPAVTEWPDLQALFTPDYFPKPLVLILDEFDALGEEYINAFVNEFRDMYIRRHSDIGPRTCSLHGLALVGVRAVLGVESDTGSPFNVQRSLRIPNLTPAEVRRMYRWYEEESGQSVDEAVVERVYYETRGQPGLVSWLGELLTEEFNPDRSVPITPARFEEVYAAAIYDLPNANIVNIISKVNKEPYRDLVLTLFRTGEKIPFRFDDPHIGYLYLNGVIDREVDGTERYIRFSSPFVQKRLFNYFAGSLFPETGRLYPPFDDLSDTLTESGLDVAALLRRYGAYLRRNRDWLLKDVPRRADLRPYEAVYHFNLYVYLSRFMAQHGGRVWPEFPTGNGKVDLLIEYAGRMYGLEVKSFSGAYEYRRAVQQAARYGRELGLEEITLVFFVEEIRDRDRARYETTVRDEDSGVAVRVMFVEVM